MARNGNGRNNRDGGDDERLGRPGVGGSNPAGDDSISGVVGEPLIPMSAQEEGQEGYLQSQLKGDHQYARDDSDREDDEREHQEREVSDDERLELFRMAMFQNQLPSLPALPGWHLVWLTTANPRDSIQGRLRLGYQLLKPSEVPGWEHNILTSGQYEGCIGVNEMVAAKLPMRLYEMYMTEAHHNQPLAEEGKLRSTLDAVRDAQGGKTQVYLEGGMAALGQNPRRAHFEEIHGPRRTPVTG